MEEKLGCCSAASKQTNIVSEVIRKGMEEIKTTTVPLYRAA